MSSRDDNQAGHDWTPPSDEPTIGTSITLPNEVKDAERDPVRAAFFAWFAEFGGPYGSIKDAQDVFTAGYRASLPQPAPAQGVSDAEDAARLLHISHKGMNQHAYAAHVLRRGGDGDLSDIRSYIDAVRTAK